jgi:hypothetical protein
LLMFGPGTPVLVSESWHQNRCTGSEH